MTDLIIIGGGAAGMAAGIMAARAGLSVTILEKNRQFGKKLSVTGNGKCNFTNKRQDISFYHSREPRLVENVLSDFSLQDTLSFFDSIGLVYSEKNGYYYPFSENAADVVKVLFDELSYLKVKCKTNLPVQNLIPTDDGFQVQTDGYSYQAKRVLITTGGMAAPQYGTTGDGYRIVSNLGHQLVPIIPALTALLVGEHPITGLAGLRWNGKIQIYNVIPTGKKMLLAEEQGELQFTTYGISGIPAMQVSRFAAQAIENPCSIYAEIDFLPSKSEDELFALLQSRVISRKERNLLNWLLGFLPEKLAGLIMKNTGFKGTKTVEELSKDDWEKLIHTLKCFSVPISGVRSMDAAQTTAGGIDLKECSPMLESLLVPGMFFAGEILDVDGACGGYNLQWAWSSAAKAVEGIVQSFR